jgi:hypothetical protein
MKFNREIKWFYKNSEDDSLQGNESIKEVPSDVLNIIIKNTTDEDDPDMVCLYQLTSSLVEMIKPFVKHKIDLEKYDYFIFCYEDKKE